MIAKIKKIFKKILLIFGLKVTNNFRIVKILRKNVFNAEHRKRRVLISYITSPFINKNDFSHTNLLECYTAAEIFNELGFCVDVIDYNSNKKINYSKYDVVYGMGMVLEKSFYFNKKKIKKIFYATGCNPIFSNVETLLRVRDFYNSHGVMLLESSRLIEQGCYLQTFLSDGVIVLGDEFVLNTYQNYDKNGIERFRNLAAFFYDINDIDISAKNFSEANKHFLWFGSSGAIHKGLDILIDIFFKRQDIYLHICGLSENEKGFLNYYNKVFLQSKNIINHGFVNIKSEEFNNLMNKCAFVISPSVSEGGSPAILNVVANGGADSDYNQIIRSEYR